MRLLMIMVIVWILTFLLLSCSKDRTAHECKYSLCPYKGYTTFPGVIATGDNAVNLDPDPDVYYEDSLHFFTLQ